MFKSIATALLNRILGDYIENLNRKQLKIGIWNGKVDMSNIILKLPPTLSSIYFTLIKGTIQSLSLTIPWKNISNNFSFLEIKSINITLLTGITDPFKIKKIIIEALTEKMRNMCGGDEDSRDRETKNTGDSDSTFITRIVTKILNNLQIIIEDVEIRVITLEGHIFMFKIDLIKMKSCNSKWECVKGVSESSSKLEGVSNKDSKLEGVSNWDSKVEGVSDSTNEQQGVSNGSSKLEGFSNGSSKLEGVSDSTNEQHPFNTNSNIQLPVDNLYSLHPVNNTYKLIHVKGFSIHMNNYILFDLPIITVQCTINNPNLLFITNIEIPNINTELTVDSYKKVIEFIHTILLEKNKNENLMMKNINSKILEIEEFIKKGGVSDKSILEGVSDMGCKQHPFNNTTNEQHPVSYSTNSITNSDPSNNTHIWNLIYQIYFEKYKTNNFDRNDTLSILKESEKYCDNYRKKINKKIKKEEEIELNEFENKNLIKKIVNLRLEVINDKTPKKSFFAYFWSQKVSKEDKKEIYKAIEYEGSVVSDTTTSIPIPQPTTSPNLALPTSPYLDSDSLEYVDALEPSDETYKILTNQTGVNQMTNQPNQRTSKKYVFNFLVKNFNFNFKINENIKYSIVIENTDFFISKEGKNIDLSLSVYNFNIFYKEYNKMCRILKNRGYKEVEGDGSKLEGVSGKSCSMEGVSDKSSNYKGVNTSTNNLHPFNDSTDKQQGVNDNNFCNVSFIKESKTLNVFINEMKILNFKKIFFLIDKLKNNKINEIIRLISIKGDNMQGEWGYKGEGVSSMDSEERGVNSSTNEQQGVNDKSSNNTPYNTPYNNHLTIVLTIRKPKISISKYFLREMGFILINQNINITAKELILTSVICAQNRFNLKIKDLEIFIVKNRIKEYIVNKVPIEIKGSIVDSVIEGIKEEGLERMVGGVNDKEFEGSSYKGVNDKDSIEEGVNDKVFEDSSYKGVSIGTGEQHPFSNSIISVLQLDSSIDKLQIKIPKDLLFIRRNSIKGVDKSVVRERGANSNPNTLHPVNNSRFMLNLYIRKAIIDLPFISSKLKGKEIRIVSDLKVEVFTFNFTVKGNKLEGCYKREKCYRNTLNYFDNFRFKGNEHVVRLKKEIEAMVMFIKKGRLDSESEGVNSIVLGLDSDKGYGLEAVSNNDREVEGFNNSTNEPKGVNICNNKQPPVNITTNTYHPVNNITDEQHPVNITTNTYHPLSLIFTNIRVNIKTPLISMFIKVREIKNQNIKKVLIKTNNTLLKISKIRLGNNTISDIRVIKDESSDKDIFYILEFLKELEVIPLSTNTSNEEIFIISNVKVISYFSLSLYSKVIFKCKNIYILFKKDSLRIEIPIEVCVDEGVLEDVNDKDSKEEGVNDKRSIEGSKLEGVNDKDSKERGVNNLSIEQQGVNNISNTLHPLNVLNISLVILKNSNGLVITPVIKGSIDNEFYRILTRNILQIIEITLNIIDCILIKSEGTFNFSIKPLVSVRLYILIDNTVIPLGVLESSIEIKGVSGNYFRKDEEIKGVSDKGSGLEGVSGNNEGNNKELLEEVIKGVNDKEVLEEVIKGVSGNNNSSTKKNTNNNNNTKDKNTPLDVISTDFIYQQFIENYPLIDVLTPFLLLTISIKEISLKPIKGSYYRGVNFNIDNAVNNTSNNPVNNNIDNAVNNTSNNPVNNNDAQNPFDNTTYDNTPFIFITNSTVIILKGPLGINTHISIRHINSLQSLTILLLIKQSYITPDYSYGIPTVGLPFNIYLKLNYIEYTTVEYDKDLNDGDSRLERLNNPTADYNPINSTNKQQGVNNPTVSTNEQHPVNITTDSTNEQHPVNITTDSTNEQHPVNITTDSTNEQHPFNNNTDSNTPNPYTLTLIDLTLLPSGLEVFISKITPFYYTNTPLRLKVSFITNPQSITTRITVSDCKINLKVESINKIKGLVNYTLQELKVYTLYSLENRISVISLILFDCSIILRKNNGSYFLKVLLNFMSLTIEKDINCKCTIGVLYYDNYLIDYYPVIDEISINVNIIEGVISVNTNEIVRGAISDGLLREIRYFYSLGVKNVLYNYSCSDIIVRTISKLLRVGGSIKDEGVSNSIENYKGVNICTDKQQGVNICTNKQQGVSNSIDEYKGVNICTDKQQGVNIGTNKQQGFDNTTLNITNTTTTNNKTLTTTNNTNTSSYSCSFTDSIATLTINNTLLYLPLNKEGTNLYTFNTSTLALEITLSELKRRINIYNPVIIKNMTEFKITVGLSNNFNDILTPFSNTTTVTPFNDSSLPLKGSYLLLQPFGYKQANKGVNIYTRNNTPTSLYFTCNDHRAMHMVLVVDIIQYKCSSVVGGVIKGKDMCSNNTPLNNSTDKQQGVISGKDICSNNPPLNNRTDKQQGVITGTDMCSNNTPLNNRIDTNNSTLYYVLIYPLYYLYNSTPYPLTLSIINTSLNCCTLLTLSSNTNVSLPYFHINNTAYISTIQQDNKSNILTRDKYYINNNITYGLYYDKKVLTIKGNKYYSLITEVTVYPLFICNNYLKVELLIGGASISEGNCLCFNLEDRKCSVKCMGMCSDRLDFGVPEMLCILSVGKSKSRERIMEYERVFNIGSVKGNNIKGVNDKGSNIKGDMDITGEQHPVSNSTNTNPNTHLNNTPLEDCLPLKNRLYKIPCYLSLSIEMVPGKGKYCKSRIINIRYSNILNNNTFYSFIVISENYVMDIGCYARKEIHLYKNNGFYLLFKKKVNNTLLSSYCSYVSVKPVSEYIRIEGVLFRVRITLENKQRVLSIIEEYKYPYYIVNSSRSVIYYKQCGSKEEYSSISIGDSKLEGVSNRVEDIVEGVSIGGSNLEGVSDWSSNYKGVNNTTDTNNHPYNYPCNQHPFIFTDYSLPLIIALSIGKKVLNYTFKQDTIIIEGYYLQCTKTNTSYILRIVEMNRLEVLSNISITSNITVGYIYKVLFTHIALSIVSGVNEVICIHLKGTEINLKNSKECYVGDSSVLEGVSNKDMVEGVNNNLNQQHPLTTNNDTHCCLDISVTSIQIDNQTLECAYPIIFYPVNVKQRFFSESKDKRKFLSLSMGFYLESILRYLTGDSDRGSEMGVNDKDREMGVSNKDCKQRGVNDKDSDRGVSNKDSKQQGVNDKDSKQHPTNNTTSNNNILHFTYVIFLLQEFVLNLEEDILTKLITFIPTHRNNTNYSYLLCNNCNKNECICFKYTSVNSQGNVIRDVSNKDIVEGVNDSTNQQQGVNNSTNTYHPFNDLLIDTLHLHPLKLRFSFLKSTKNHFISYLLSFILQNISSLKLKFNTLLITDISSYNMLTDIILDSYKVQLISQMYKIFGSLDFLGNLGSLVDSFSLGVHDLFYEPYSVLSTEGTSSIDFTVGILKGGKSFIKNTLSGVSNTFSRVTSSISKGVSLASLDKDFNEKMNISNNLLYYTDEELLFPSRLLGNNNKYGRFVDSCVSGVKGIVEKPVEGFKKGFKGFLVGVGKGIVGAVAKPVAGITDLACSVSESVRDRVSGGEVVRIQYCRVVGIRVVVIGYDSKEEDVNYNSSREEGVSNSGIKEEGVNYNSSKEEGVNYNSGKQEGVSDKEYELPPFNNSTNTYHPVNNSTDIQHLFNTNLYTQHPLNSTSLLGLPVNYRVVERDTLYDLNRSKGFYIFNKYVKEGCFIDGSVGVIGVDNIMVILIREGVVLSGKECFCMVEWWDVRMEGNSFYVGKVCVVVYKKGFIDKMVVIKEGGVL